MPQSSTPLIHGKVYCIGRYGSKVIDTLRQLDPEHLKVQAVVPTCEAVYPLTNAPLGETMPEEEMGPENRLAGQEGMVLLKLVKTRVDQQLIVIVADLSDRVSRIAATLLVMFSRMRGAAATVVLLRGSREEQGDEAKRKALKTMNEHSNLVVHLDEPPQSIESCLSAICGEKAPIVLCDSPDVQALIDRIIDSVRASA